MGKVDSRPVSVNDSARYLARRIRSLLIPELALIESVRRQGLTEEKPAKSIAKKAARLAGEPIP